MTLMARARRVLAQLDRQGLGMGEKSFFQLNERETCRSIYTNNQDVVAQGVSGCSSC